jgi:hypothetical protein
MRALLLSMLLSVAGAAYSQDALQVVLETVPGAVGLAGSPENLASLVQGLTSGKPVRLVGAAVPGGFDRVVTFTAPARLTSAQAAELLQGVHRDFDLLGIARPTPEQLAGALGVPPAALRSALEPDRRQPTPEERAVAALPADIRSLVAGLAPKEALRVVELAGQQLVALGVTYPSPEQKRQMVARVRYGTGYVEASAGASSFPPLSPLVAAPLWQP